jgi:hypothetical protein
VSFAKVVLLCMAVGLFSYCKAGSSGDSPNQGAIQQTPEGQIVVNLANRGIRKDPRFTDVSMVAIYLYKKKDYSLSCTNAADRRKCEDILIFKNEKIDSLGFSNEPGYFGYDPDFKTYFPNLIADTGYNYPSSKPADPQGFADPDVWQCLRNPFVGTANYNKYECGVNSHPIRSFNKDLTTYTLQVYATDAQGFATSYILDYNLFNSLNHPVKDGDRYFAYMAVHFKSHKAAADSEDRFDASASTWKRPIEPDLVSPRVEIKIKLLAEGHHDKPGSTYDIPDYSTWYDPYTDCRATRNVPAGSIYYSEIMWMGSKDTNGTGASEDKFVEIYNSNSFDVYMSGWKLNGVGAGASAITLPTCSLIKANSVYTVGAQTNKAFKKFDLVSGLVSLTNTGEATLNIQDAAGTIISSVTGCTTGPWGSNGLNGGANAPKRSMRLTAIGTAATTCAANWSTTSVSDTSYSTSSGNLNSGYSATADTATEGTVATPGYAGP